MRFGLHGHQGDQLRAARQRLEEPTRRRSRVRGVRPPLEVDVDSHGRPGGPLRDPVLRNVALAQNPLAAV